MQFRINAAHLKKCGFNVRNEKIILHAIRNHN